MERGYAGTTTSEVQRRAGTSRGAVLHHFPSRGSLLAGAIRYLIEAREAGMRQAALRLPTGADRIDGAIEVLWSTFKGTLFWAAMELWLAARTDRELRQDLLPQERWLGGVIREWCDELFGPAVCQQANYEIFRDTLLESMRGHALGNGLRGQNTTSHGPVERWTTLGHSLFDEGLANGSMTVGTSATGGTPKAGGAPL